MDSHSRQVGAVDCGDVGSLMRWVVPEPRVEATWTNFQGHSIIRRSQGTRVASWEEETSLPLQEVYVGTLSLEWVRRRTEDEALRLFDEVWNLMINTGGTSKSDRESHLRIATEDAHKMKQAGVIGHASDLPTKGWAIPSSVVEEKTAGRRRGFIAWPKVKNAKNDYEAEVPLGHISRYLSAVCNEAVALFDLEASFLQADMPRDIRAGFRCRTENGELVELNWLPVVYKGNTEIVHTITRALAGGCGGSHNGVRGSKPLENPHID
ncbi:unnamed protein product [Trypanosoma congolense IL3000]|uniref:WGS project CAEQ00000000 data, annotated contig 2246 n=1 Tax=Trypanosoma congolense (strain IL3000) TaxID=1068625 RepID=F9WCM0_TRYCI|nr:unnamed protein product [Trypanosoma congolense IL3000]